MTATITLQPEDIAELIATAIGDGLAWLIRWTLVLLILLTRCAAYLAVLISRWAWGIVLPTIGRWLMITGLLLAFCWRLSAALAVNIFRWWKYRDLSRYVDAGGAFIQVEYAGVTV